MNFSQTFQLLNDLNFTANCATAEAWRANHAWTPNGNNNNVGFANDTTNFNFISMAWPAARYPADNIELSAFYDSISTEIPNEWTRRAFDAIDRSCIAPSLARRITMASLNYTQNCTATSQHHAKVLCATNRDSVPAGILYGGAFHNQLSDRRKVDFAFFASNISELDDSNGVAMIRDSWPYNASAISNLTLAEWARITMEANTSDIFRNESLDFHSLIKQICQTCINEFCTVAHYKRNLEVAGIGIVVSYVLASTVATLHVAIYVVSHLMKIESSLCLRAIREATENKENHKLLKDSTWFFMFSLAIAFVVVLNGHPALSDTFYETSVATSALYLAVSVYLAVLFFNLNESDRLQKYRFATGGLLCVGILIYVIEVEATLIHLGSNSGQGDWPCFGSILQKLGYAGTSFYAAVIGIGLIGVGMWWTINILSRFRKFRQHLVRPRRYQAYIVGYFHGQTPPQHISQMFYTVRIVTTLAFLAIAWLETFYIIFLRKALHSFHDAAVEEDDWGFGQILAVLLWLPFTADFSFQLLKRWRDLRRLSKSYEKEPVQRLQHSTLPSLHIRYPTQYHEYYQQEARNVRSERGELTGDRKSLALRMINTF